MSYTLDQLILDCRAALRTNPGAGGREQVRACVARACVDEGFVATHLSPENDSPRRVLHEDSELGFCILAHVYAGNMRGRPHDHGPSWAIYAQVQGTTEMTDWQVEVPAEGGRPGKVRALRTYKLKPGDAHLYNEGEVHSPSRMRSTRLIRVEGINLDGVARGWYDPL